MKISAKKILAIYKRCKKRAKKNYWFSMAMNNLPYEEMKLFTKLHYEWSMKEVDNEESSIYKS